MATVSKILGQYSPSAASEYTLYTVPAAKSAQITGLVICNTNTSTAVIRVAVLLNGESTTTTKNYVAYNKNIYTIGEETILVGMQLSAGTKIKIYSNLANVSFTLSGYEVG